MPKYNIPKGICLSKYHFKALYLVICIYICEGMCV